MTNLITKSPDKWIVPCGKCGKERHYSTYKNWKRAQYSKCLCLSCAIKRAATGRGIIGEFSRNCPQCNAVIRYRNKKYLFNAIDKNRLCDSCCQILSSTGRLHTAETKKKIKDHHARPWQGTTGPWFGKHRSEETKCKLRQSMVAKVRARCGGTLKYNPIASELFVSIEKEFGFNGMFGGKTGEYYISELGYYPDYYEPLLNLIIEYDERAHTRLSRRTRDEKRQQEITDYLGCKFLRISESDSRSQVTLKIRGIL